MIFSSKIDFNFPSPLLGLCRGGFKTRPYRGIFMLRGARAGHEGLIRKRKVLMILAQLEIFQRTKVFQKT